VAVCDDKAATHLTLAARHIPMPHTLLAPMTYVQMDEQADAFLRLAADKLGFPMVVKECFGSLGGQVYLAHDDVELRRLARDMAARPFLVQQFVAASAGQDVRLYVVGNRVVASMCRRSDTDFRANIGNGGHAEAYMPSDEEIALALESCSILGLYFAGVDLLHDVDGQPLICEVNSNAHMNAITACTGVDVAGAIVDFVFEQETSMRESMRNTDYEIL
jgi:ribosomal protein S6--L-glutamate ligase/gamma-F420-2:alpha-L-glutamate ligase